MKTSSNIFKLVKINLVLLAVFWLLRHLSEFETLVHWHSRFLYPALHGLYSFLGSIAGYSGCSLFDCLLLLVILLAVRGLYRSYSRFQKWKFFIRAPLRLLVIALLLANWFQLSWGFFYQHKNFAAEKKMATLVKKTTREHHRLYYQVLQRLKKITATNTQLQHFDDQSFETYLPAIKESLEQLKPAFVPPGKIQSFRGGSLNIILTWVSASGMFSPFSNETFIARTVTPLARIFVAAHEMAHLMGYAREDDAQLAAFLALGQSKNPVLQFAALRYVILFVPLHPEKQAHAHRLPPVLQRDLVEGVIRYIEHPPYVAKLAWAIYNTLLKSQGVEEGVRSYGVIGRLVMAEPSYIAPLLK